MKKKIIFMGIILLLITGCGDVNVINNYNDTKSDNLIDVKKSNDEEVSDDELVSYIENVNQEIDDEDENTLKNTFVTLTDFIFYGGKIKGKTFSELKNDTKEKIIELYEKIDSKIESKYPNYKDRIKVNSKNTYNDLSDKVKEAKEKFKSEYPDIYEEYENGKQDMSDVYDEYEPYIESGKEKAKDVYSSVKEKISSWYNEYKD